METEEDQDKTRKTPRMFSQTKYVMKPLDQFLDEKK